MTPSELDRTLDFLGLNQVETAALLKMTPRSVNRWYNKGVPRPIASTLAAWRELKDNGLPWRPGSLSLAGYLDVRESIDAIKTPTLPWAVDLKRQDATLGPILITFNLIDRGPYHFRPVSYERTDAKPDLERDRAIIQDGICRIALHVRARSAA